MNIKGRYLRIRKQHLSGFGFCHTQNMFFHIRDNSIDIFGKIIRLFDINLGRDDKNMSCILFHIIKKHNRRFIYFKNLHFIVQSLRDIGMYQPQQIRFFDIIKIETSNDRSLEQRYFFSNSSMNLYRFYLSRYQRIKSQNHTISYFKIGIYNILFLFV